jgi:hypothetical protein
MRRLAGLSGTVDELLALVCELNLLGFEVEEPARCAAEFAEAVERRFGARVDADELAAALRIGVLARDEQRRCTTAGRQ